jgi:hypothetical protein
MSLHVLAERALTGDAARDAAAILRSVRNGRVYTAIDGLASPPAFQFTATNARGTATYGDVLEAGGPVTLRVRSNAPSSFTTTLWQGNRRLAIVQKEANVTRTVSDSPAIYRVEIHAPSEGGAMPWIVSNPIYVGLTFPQIVPRSTRPGAVTHALFDGRTMAGWHLESDRTSSGTLDIVPGPRGAEISLRYALSTPPEAHPFVALVAGPMNVIAPTDRLSFVARAEHPMRISVGIRNRSARGEQWTRSVYVDETPRTHTIHLDEMAPVDVAGSPRPPAADIKDVLFVIETTHTKPGSAGWLWIRSAALEGSDLIGGPGPSDRGERVTAQSLAGK